MSCPAGMIGISGGFCIDAEETTNRQYLTFVEAGPDVAAQPLECAWNTGFVPVSNWPPNAGAEERPVTFVDWCDARGYCESLGKRLCGAVGGGPAIVTQFDSADHDEWFQACSSNGQNDYPYGVTYDANACNGADFGAGQTIPVGAAPDCEGPEGVFDLSGNVYEWEDSCAGTGAATDPCRIRGGAYNNNGTLLRCDVDASDDRSAASVTIGIRCCSDPL